MNSERIPAGILQNSMVIPARILWNQWRNEKYWCWGGVYGIL